MSYKNKKDNLDMDAEVMALDAEALVDEAPEEEGSYPMVDQSGSDENKALKLRVRALEEQNKNLQEQASIGGAKAPQAKPGYVAVVHPGTKGDVSYFKKDIFDKPKEAA